MNKVLITPNSNLSLQDFAKIYAGEGADPYDADFNIRSKFPSGAQSVMNRSWKALNIDQHPADYFASVAKSASPAAIPQVQAPATAWPTFSNEVDRNIAIDSGAVDYRYPSPLQKTRAQALDQITAVKAAQYRQAAVAQAPGVSDTFTPGRLLQHQLAGDNGTARKILFNLNNTGLPLEGPALSYEDWLARKSSGDSTIPDIKGYTPNAGVGNLANTTDPSRLDKNVYFDPTFQRELQRNPENANFVYSRLTGRTLDSDIKEHLDLRKSQIDIGRKYAAEQLQAGATYDPRTKAWRVLNTEEAPEGGGVAALTGSQRPYKQFVQATPVQSNWLNTHAPAITGSPLAQYNPRGEGEVQSRLQQLQNDPVFQEHKQAREKGLRRSLNNDEILHLVDEVQTNKLRDAADPSKLPWYMKLGVANDAAVTSLLGIDPNSDPENPQPAAWLKWITHPSAPRSAGDTFNRMIPQGF